MRSLSSSQMDRLGQGRFLGIATLLGVLIVILYATSIGRYASPWMGDAARYIEAARSLLRGEPLLISGPDGPKPMSLWPPGYPVLGSAVAMAGLPVHEALLLVTQASVAACVPALTWALLEVLPGRAAVLLGIFGALGSGLVSNANLASADAVFCLTAMLAAGCVIRRRWVLAGLFVSIGFCLRNAAVALAGATAIVALLEQPFRFAAILHRLRQFALGAAPGLAALLLWNRLALGSLSPYVMPPSTRSLWTNLGDLGAAFNFELLPVYALSRSIPYGLSLGAAAAFCGGVVVLGLTRRDLPAQARRLMLFAGIYLALGFMMLVHARSRYEWGEIIWERHVAQYDWVILPALMASCLALHDRWRKRLLIAGMFLAICGIAIRTADIANRFAFYAHTAPEVSRIITTGDVKGADPRLQLRQFFQAWERTPELANVVAQLNSACGLVTPIYDLLLAVYDVRSVPSERLQETAPVVLLDPATPPAIVSADWAKALPGSNGALQLVPLPNLPAGIHVYSNAPGLCFRKPARPA
ncbi:MAG: hypothetical protein JSS43_29710 [Proteobacteria bacterium]|nr:hypothetical protein [Pseudomonadota bacterium]